MSRPLITLTALSTALLALPTWSDTPLNDQLSLYGDFRTGYFNQQRDDRVDSKKETSENWRVRLRVGLKAEFNQNWSAALRVAGRYATDEANHRFFVDGATTTDTGQAFGDSTFDEAYLQYRNGKEWSLRVGRFQHKYELMGVAKKSLDRLDSPSSDINWTDGVQLKNLWGHGWQSDLVIEHNSEKGPSNVKRAPLSFVEEGSRWSAYAALSNTQKLGPIVQREVSVTYLPDALVEGNSNQDHYAIVGRLAAEWPLSDSGSSLMLAGEFGAASNTPENADLKLTGSGESDSTAYQMSVNLMNFLPRHSIGLVYARADAGWLISPDFRPNTDMVEIRYQWKLDKKQSVEARIRRREDRDALIGSLQKRADDDFYIRYTYKF